ncbi:MAG: helix-turn-helix domain-containing protein [Methanobacteriota archaeon]
MIRERTLVDLPSPIELAGIRSRAMKQKEMAALLGVDKGQLSRWEAGKGEMAYEKIRRYVHILNLRLAAADPTRFLVDRILARGPLPELKPMDRLDAAIEAMLLHDVSELPVLTARGDDYAGVLTSAAVCETLVEAELAAALVRPVGSVRLEPLDRVRPRDTLQRIAALLASQSLVLVEGDDGLPVGFATRGDLFPLLLGQSTRAGARPKR